MNYKLSGEFDVRQILNSLKTLQNTAQTTSKNIKDSFSTVGGIILPNKMLGLADSIGAVDNKLVPVRNNLPKVTQGFQGLQNQSGTTTMALFQVSNAFQDFAVAGIRGAANNINFLLQLMPTMVKDAGGVKNAFKQLGQTLKGPLGIIIGIQVLISVIDMLYGGMKKAETKTTDLSMRMIDAKNATDEFTQAVISFKDEISELPDEKLLEYLVKVDNALEDTQKRLAKVVSQKVANPFYDLFLMLGIGEDPEKLMEEARDLANQQDEIINTFNDRGILQQLSAQIKTQQEKLKIAQTESEILTINRELTRLENEKKRLTELGTKSKENDLITTDAQLKKQIALVKEKLKGNNSDREAFLLNKKLKELLTDLSLLDPVKNVTPAVDKIKQDIPETLETIQTINKPDAFDGASQGISTLTVSTNIFQSAVQQAGQATVSQFTGMIRVFGRANSVLQGFINSLAQIALQMTATGLWGGVLSIISGGTFGAGFLKILGLADGGIVTKPTLSVIGEGKEPEAVLPLSKLNKIINTNNSIGNININLSGETRTSGRDLVTSYKKANYFYRRKYT